MTHEERLSYVKSYGLISLQQLAEIADDELEIIGSEANSETEFRELYDSYTKKYEGFLINNQYDTSDLSLYVPEGDDMATYVINEEHKVVIGDKIKTVSLENDMSEADKAVLQYRQLFLHFLELSLFILFKIFMLIQRKFLALLILNLIIQ